MLKIRCPTSFSFRLIHILMSHPFFHAALPMHVSQTLGTRQARTAGFDCAILCPCKPKIWRSTGLMIRDFLFVCLCILIVPWLLCYLWAGNSSNKFLSRLKTLNGVVKIDVNTCWSSLWGVGVETWDKRLSERLAMLRMLLVMQCTGSMMFVSCKICGLLFLVIRADMHSWHVFVYRAALRLGCSWPCDWMALLASWHAGMLFPSCLVSVSRTLTARLCRIGTKNGFKTLDWKDRGPNSGLLFNQLNFLRATSMSAHRFYKIRNRALLRWEFHWFQMVSDVSACFSQYKVHLAQSLLHAIKPGGCYGWY